MKVGDPSPRSAADVLADRAYACVSVEQSNSVIELVVLHRGTETHWQTTYQWNQDKLSAAWFEVVPEIVTTTRYRTV